MIAVLVILIVLAIGIIASIIIKPSVATNGGGKMLAFLGLFLLPVLAGWMGVSEHLERSKTTGFCLSCHVMTDYGKSLYVDDNEYVPAAHFQNNRIPRDKACYTCHTNYTMYGGANDKLRGMQHLYVYYFGTISKPLKLYTPFDNRECLHCHEGARTFEESEHHHKEPTTLAAIKQNKLSCTYSYCHDVIHNVNELKDADFWKPGGR